MLSVEIIKRSFFATINNLDTILKITAFWVPLMLVATLPLIVAGTGVEPYASSALPWIMTQVWYIWLPLVVIMVFVGATGAAFIAIAWHRFLVLGETLEKVLVWPKDWPVRRYFLTGLVLFIIPMIIVVVVVMWATFSSLQNGAMVEQQYGFAAFWQTFGSNLAIYLVFLVWGLKLPAIAVEKSTHYKPISSFTFGDSLHYTSRSFPQIVILAVVFSFVMTLIEALQVSIFGASLITDVKTALGGLISSLLSYVLMFFTVGLLSELYKALVQTRQSQEATA